MTPKPPVRSNSDSQSEARAVLSVELMIVTVIDGTLKVLLDQRTDHPFKGTWVLPGGAMRVSNTRQQGESLGACVDRVLTERTGLKPSACCIEQLHTFGRAGRDPRTRVVSVGWLVGVSPTQAERMVADQTQWYSVFDDVPWMRLGFDHAEIIAMGESRIQDSIDRGTMAFALAPKDFTVADLRTVYETVLGKPQDARNFRRRFQRMTAEGLVAHGPGKRHQGKSRPAQVWRFSGKHTNR